MKLDPLTEAVHKCTWEHTYRLSESDSVARSTTMEMAIASREEEEPSEKGDNLFADELLFHAKWLHHGKVELVVGHKYAAALMSTSLPEDMEGDLFLPWKAFSIDIPVGLLETEVIRFTRISVVVYDFDEGAECRMTIHGFRVKDPSTKINYARKADNPCAVFFSKELDVISETSLDLDVKERAMVLAIRLVTGLIYTIQNTENFRDRTYTKPNRHGHRRGPPHHRVYWIGAPISTDCRSEVVKFMNGNRKGPPSVQTFVRGHYKRQVVGTARAARKVIWIEPYWRGPEDAPILSRPYMVEAAAS